MDIAAISSLISSLMSRPISFSAHLEFVPAASKLRLMMLLLLLDDNNDDEQQLTGENAQQHDGKVEEFGGGRRSVSKTVDEKSSGGQPLASSPRCLPWRLPWRSHAVKDKEAPLMRLCIEYNRTNQDRSG